MRGRAHRRAQRPPSADRCGGSRIPDTRPARNRPTVAPAFREPFAHQARVQQSGNRVTALD